MRLSDGRTRRLRRATMISQGAHELTFSCHRGLRLLNSDRTRQWLVNALDRARRLYSIHLLAYVIMPEHAHVLIDLRDEHRMPLVLKSIKQAVSRRAVAHLRANAPHHLERLRVVEGQDAEHRFWEQGGGYDRTAITSTAVWNMIHYIHRNPVRRGLVLDPGQWVWSSAAWYAGRTDVPLVMDRIPSSW